MKTYTTVQGDMWDNIALSQLGSTDYTDVLIKANPEYINTLIFSSGCVLYIPEVTEKISADDVPPWRRVSG